MAKARSRDGVGNRGPDPAPVPVWRDPNRVILLLEHWDEIYPDIDKTLKASAGLPRHNAGLEALEALVSISVPAFCRRTCELGANVGTTQRGISADILVCHENDTREEVLKVRVLESFPSYQLDRTISTPNGVWQPHVRTIHYGKPDDASKNGDVIAKALIRGDGLLEDVKPATSTPSELEQGIFAVYSLLPPSLFKGSTLKQIQPGTVVSMSLVFFNKEAFGPESFVDTGNKIESLKKILDLLYGLSLLSSSPRRKQNDAVAKLLARVKGGEKFSFTDIARACLRSKTDPGRR